jgi:putative membrane protein
MTPWLLALHVLGFALWMGGLLGSAAILGQSAAAARKLMRALADPGAGLAIVAGLWMLSADAAGYFAQAWFQTKMVVAVGLLALHGVIAVRAKRAASSEAASGPAWGLFFAVLAAAVAMIFLSLPGRMMW